ncbi:MAG TPA: hypothetical protein VIG46_09895 [Candidatus Baltobacteraceae bacterium]|jgi:hypothetical protein
MKVVHEIYDFVAGGSIAAPVGLAIAILTAVFAPHLDPTVRAATFVAIVVLTLAAATREKIA